MDVKSAHQFSSLHRRQVEASSVCGCFFCLSTFAPSEITEWVDENQTALCPSCNVDSVIGSESGVPLSQEFLSSMRSYWFWS
ncbi:cytoplasmic protein [Hydrogenophaga sp. A37]|nr:cytoplasmic protein [Hydrogenophaga sp. A37]